MSRIGIVAIGRNEGERLRRCLDSIVGRGDPVVYVDSGSTDDSVALAESKGACVVRLDMSIPFTAARARNVGFERLLELDPHIKFVQFVDGDCEIVRGWFVQALRELRKDSRLAVVAGRRREQFPDKSIYNRLCDVEWNTPIGEAKACGGDAMMRVEAFREVDGFQSTLIAGEEPELCCRIRQRGWTIRRIDAEMTHHDAAITRFGQWWKRTLRAGHAYAENASLHGKTSERHRVRESYSIWFWGLVFPIAAIASIWPLGWMSSLLVLAYLALGLRIMLRKRRSGLSLKYAAAYAGFVVLGKLPQAIGQMKFRTGKLLGRRSTLIEYKDPATI